MVWECNTLMNCECGYLNSSKGQKSAHKQHFPSNNNVSCQVSEAPPLTTQSINKYWRSLMQLYTTRHLSYESDYPLALCELANQIYRGMKQQRRPNIKYIAGLWTHNFPSDLCWEVSTAGIGKRPLAYRVGIVHLIYSIVSSV